MKSSNYFKVLFAMWLFAIIASIIFIDFYPEDKNRIILNGLNVMFVCFNIFMTFRIGAGLSRKTKALEAKENSNEEINKLICNLVGRGVGNIIIRNQGFPLIILNNKGDIVSEEFRGLNFSQLENFLIHENLQGKKVLIDKVVSTPNGLLRPVLETYIPGKNISIKIRKERV